MKDGYDAKFDYSYLVLSYSGFDQNWKMLFIYLFDWFENWKRNDEKWHIRNIQVVYKIIIIVQYTIAEGIASVVQYHGNYNNMLITYPFKFHYRRTNNPPCIVNKHILG